MQTLREIDTVIFSFINKNLQNSVFDISMPFITDKYYFVILLIAAWLVIKDKKNALFPIILTLVSVALSDWSANIVKHLVGRIRPCHTVEGVNLLVGCTSSFSMPSNHAANSAAIILAISYMSKKWVRWAAIIVAALVGFSRVYIGVHYPFDVFIGALIGVAVSIFVIKFYEWASVRYKSNPYTTTLFISLLGISLFRIFYITAGVLDLSPDEAHYWEWSRRLDLSYYSKGLMIAYLTALGTAVFGDNVFGIRIMAVLFSALSSVLLYTLGKKLFEERTGAAAAILMQIIPLFSAYGVLFTIDSPFIFFWILSLYLFWKALTAGVRDLGLETSKKTSPQSPASSPLIWLLLGISIGLGLLTKYTMAFFYMCAFLFLLTSKQHRKLLFTKAPYLSLVISLIVFSPVIIWNFGNDWVTLKHTAGQANIAGQFSLISKGWLKNFSEFLGSQIGLISPIIFFMMFYAIFKLKKSDNSRASFLFWFSIPVVGFFLLKSFHGKVQANWALPGYAAGFIAFSALFIGRWETLKQWLKWFIIIGAVLSLFITAIAHYPAILNLSPKMDPTSRTRGWKELGAEVSRISDELSAKGPFFIFSERYQVSSELAFYVKGQPITYCANLGRRMNQYDLWPGFNTLINFNAIFVTIDDVRMPEAVGAAFDRCDKQLFTVFSNEKKLRDYSIFTCYAFKGMRQKGILSY